MLSPLFDSRQRVAQPVRVMQLSNAQLRVLSLLLTLPLAVFASTLLDHDNHALVHERLADTWYQDSDSHVHALFPRDSEDVTYVPVGSPGKILELTLITRTSIMIA